MTTTKASMDKILELAFDHTISPMAILDKNFNFIKVNEAYTKADNREVSEFSGRNHFDLYPSDCISIFEEAIKTKKVYQAFAKPFVYEKTQNVELHIGIGH